jgi:hypothetical protein
MSVRCTRFPLVVLLVVPLLALAACGGDDESDSDASPPSGDEADAAGSEGPCTSLDEGTIEELFDVAVTAASDEVNGPTFCNFGIDGTPGYGFDVTALSESVETFDDAVAQMESDPVAAEGSGLQHLDVGEEAAGFANTGVAFVVVSVGDQIVQVGANLPPDHPLAADDDALFETTTALAAEVA